MRDLTIKITADTSQAEPALKRVDGSLDAIGKSAATASKETGLLDSSLVKIVAGVGGVVALSAAYGRLTSLVKVSVGAFAEQEAATVKLTTALTAQGQATPAVITQYEALATQFQRTTKFSDDLITEMEALLVQVGNVLPSQMRVALTAATDLAAGLGIDLRTATMLVGKAFAGETGTLARYGIVIEQARLKAEGMPYVLGLIHDKFGGQAQAQLETYTGKVENLSNRWNDFQERIGQVVITALSPLLAAFEALPEVMQTVLFGIVALGTVLVPLAVGFASITIAVGGAGGVIAALTALLPFLGPAGLIAGAVIAVYLAFKHWDAIKETVYGVYVVVKTWLVDAFDGIVAAVKAKLDAVLGFFTGLYDRIKAIMQSVASMAGEAAAAGAAGLDSGAMLGAGMPAFGMPTHDAMGGIALPSPVLPSFAGGSRGYQNFGSGTPAMLHGWEKVTPYGQGGGESVSIGDVHVHGNIDSASTAKRLARDVTDQVMRRISSTQRLTYSKA